MVALTLLGALGLALLVYRYDMYEREPWTLLLAAFVAGMLGFWLLSYAEDWLLLTIPGGVQSRWAQAIVAGGAEEGTKFVLVALVWLAVPRHFNDPFDGLIYGAMAGLGLGVGESVFYLDLMSEQVAWYDAMSQETVRLMLHILLGGLGAVGLGFARFRIGPWRIRMLAALVAAMTLHTLWDYYCGIPGGELSPLLQRGIAVGLMLASLALFGLAVVTAQHHSANTHSPNQLKELWGWPFRRTQKSSD